MKPEPRPLLQHHRDEFHDRNLFLQLALGLASSSRRLDALLDRHGKCVGEPAPLDREGAALIDFVLGVISFRDRVMSTLGAARLTPPSSPPAADDAPAQVLR